MAKQRRHFSAEEKYSILREAEREGHMETCRMYNLASSVLAYWKKKYHSRGKDGLKASYHKVDPEARRLQEENVRFKRIIARQAIELESKTELLKKSDAHFQKGGGRLNSLIKNPRFRLVEHNTKPFNTFSSGYLPWELRAVFRCGDSAIDAIRLEKFIKRQKDHNLIIRLCSPEFQPTGILSQLVSVPDIKF